jgi:hypothetical protein
MHESFEEIGENLACGTGRNGAMKVFVVGFPKSGTLTIDRALRSSGLRTAHWKVPEGFCGELIYRADRAGRDPLWFLRNYDCITEAGVCLPGRKLNFWPNLDFPLLGRIRRFHPECLFLLNYRDPAKIAASMQGWADLHARLVKSDIPGLPPGAGGRQIELENWIKNHFAACQSRFSNDARFLELDIEDPDAAKILSEALGAPIRWWGVAHAGPRAHSPRPPGKFTDIARAKRIAARFLQRLVHRAVVPLGFVRETLRSFREP